MTALNKLRIKIKHPCNRGLVEILSTFDHTTLTNKRGISYWKFRSAAIEQHEILLPVDTKGIGSFVGSGTLKKRVKRNGATFWQIITEATVERTMILPTKQRLVRTLSFDHSPEAIEFYSNFDGLRERPWNESGYFVSRRDMIPLRKYIQLLGVKIDDLSSVHQKYTEALVIFGAANGDLLVQGHSGSFHWLVLETGKAKKCASSFSEVITLYSKHHLKFPYKSFDSYSRLRK